MAYIFSKIYSAAFLGLDAIQVEIEVDLSSSDKQLILLVGLPDAAVKESKERVFAAIRNSGFTMDSLRCTINLAPGELKKEGAFYDLPIALGVLHSLKIFQTPFLEEYLIVGELGLNGEVRPVRGILAATLLARSLGKKGIVLPKENAKEASFVKDLDVVAVGNLKEALSFFKAPDTFPRSQISELCFSPTISAVDFSDIKGQKLIKRALEIAAAGGHNVLLSGSPGTGKTMAAKALAGILPELSLEEALEITKVHSMAGFLPDSYGIVKERPFRSPHHTISYAGMVGGGVVPQPGEVSLAHKGILFLDELPEFSRATLESMRQPLEDRTITVSRAQGHTTYPADFICIAAMNPCPCGYLGHPNKTCKDSTLQVDRYKRKISGPFLDRIDMHMTVLPVPYQQIIGNSQEESSNVVRERVKEARNVQKKRLGGDRTNSLLNSKEIKKWASQNSTCRNILKEAVEQFSLSVRAHDRIIKVSRTIADLAHSAEIEEEHLLEALHFRS